MEAQPSFAVAKIWEPLKILRVSFETRVNRSLQGSVAHKLLQFYWTNPGLFYDVWFLRQQSSFFCPHVFQEASWNRGEQYKQKMGVNILMPLICAKLKIFLQKSLGKTRDLVYYILKEFRNTKLVSI